MTRYAIIEPQARKIRTGLFNDYRDAVRDAGLNPSELDFGTCARWPDGRTLSIIVYEFGLMNGDPSAYFGFNGSLYNGPAVLFMANSEGETIDISEALVAHFASESCPHFLWFADLSEVEDAIRLRKIARPQSAVNGKVVWQWTGKAENIDRFKSDMSNEMQNLLKKGTSDV
jgi:hypothetical protein